ERASAREAASLGKRCKVPCPRTADTCLGKRCSTWNFSERSVACRRARTSSRSLFPCRTDRCSPWCNLHQVLPALASVGRSSRVAPRVARAQPCAELARSSCERPRTWGNPYPSWQGWVRRFLPTPLRPHLERLGQDLQRACKW